MMDDVAVRESSVPYVWRGKNPSSLASNGEGASQRLSPGLLIYPRSRHLLHMNRRAWDLTARLNGAGTGLMLSRVVSDLRMQLHDLLDSA